MMRAHTEYNGNAHTRDGQCMVTLDDTRVDLFIVVVFNVNFKSTSPMMRAHTEGQPWKSSRQ